MIAIGLSILALWLALAALAGVRQLKSALALLLDRATRAEREHTDTLEARTRELEAARARLEALRQKYEFTVKQFQASVAIDGPLGSRRIQ